MRITVVSLQGLGDYLLKAPFFHELSAAYPQAEVTVITNPRGGEIYPLIDSRLRVIVIDKREGKAALAIRAIKIPRADLLYLLDFHPATQILAFILRAKRKVGWTQSISKLFHGDGSGFRDYHWASPIVSKLLGLVLAEKRVRLPETLYEGHVELGLLAQARTFPRLAQYRSAFALPGIPRADREFIYCATFASWVARQLDAEKWRVLLQALLERFPAHRLIVDGPAELLSPFKGEPRLEQLRRSDDLADLFRLISAADAVVCSDSFLTHLASWYDVPAVAFFGPASPHRFAPTAPGSTALFHAPACSPCVQQSGSAPCLAGHTQCLSFQQIGIEEVCRGVAKALAARA